MSVREHYRVQRRLGEPRRRALPIAALDCALDRLTDRMAGRSLYPAWYLLLRRWLRREGRT